MKGVDMMMLMWLVLMAPIMVLLNTLVPGILEEWLLSPE
jgi:hypothetical protein